MFLRLILVPITLLTLLSSARAGLYYSGEQFAELPSQWRGFLLDQRLLRQIAVKPTGGQSPHPVRQRYEEAATELEKTARQRKLTADEQADLGALYVRQLGEIAKALERLRSAQREHGAHFRIAANLGTAWQLSGDLGQAITALQEAVRLAPGKLQRAEELQLKLVRYRQRQKDAQELDDLFGIRYMGPGGKYEAGVLAPAESKKLTSDALGLVQQLALWLPSDGRLLWQLGELCNAHGDVRMAAAIMDGCVTEFNMSAPELRRHRQVVRDAAELLAKLAPAGESIKTVHEGHAGGFKARSLRPLVSRLERVELPPVTATGTNHLPWSVLTETAVDRKFKPMFSKYLFELNGKEVALAGFMQPLGDNPDSGTFMLIEYPVGCWYCEMPEVSGIVLVEMSAGKAPTFTRNLIKVTGKLTLNANDPENFLYTIGKAKVNEAD